MNCEIKTTKDFKAELTAEQIDEALRAYVAQVNDCAVPADAVVRVSSRGLKAKGGHVAWTEETVDAPA